MDKSITGNHSELNHAGAIAEQSALRNKNIELQEGDVFRPRSSGSWSAFSAVGKGLVPFPKAASRRKTFSESSDAPSLGEGMEPAGSSTSITGSNSRLSSVSSEPSDQKNLTFGNSNQVVYDIDGKFPYTYYENKPTLYDIDGAHRYKYFKAFTSNNVRRMKKNSKPSDLESKNVKPSAPSKCKKEQKRKRRRSPAKERKEN